MISGLFFGLTLGMMLAWLLVWVCLSGLFMYFGARMAGVTYAGFGQSVLAALGANLGGFFIFGLFAPILPVLNMFIALAAMLYIIKLVYGIDWGKAFLVWIFNLVAGGIAFLLLFIGGLIAIL